jgi:hypothetical protein
MTPIDCQIIDTSAVIETTADIILIELVHGLQMLGRSFVGIQWQSDDASTGPTLPRIFSVPPAIHAKASQ